MGDTPKQPWLTRLASLPALVRPNAKSLAEEPIDDDSEIRRFGYSVILVVFFGFGGWALFAPLESAAIGQGIVQVEGSKKIVQHLEGGIVTAILAGNGDYVIEGQPVLQLDVTQWLAEQMIAEGRIWAMTASIGRLVAERDGNAEITFAPELDDAVDARAQTAMDSERALFEARKSSRLGEISVLEQRILQLEEQMAGSKAALQARQTVASSIESEIDDLKLLLADGYVDRQRIRSLERSLAQTLGEVSEFSAAVASAEIAKEEARLNIMQLQQRFITEVVNDLRKATDDLYDLGRRREVASDRVARATIRAPASGYIVELQPNTIGGVVNGGQEILSISPDVDRLVIKAKMSPMDIDRMLLGQEVEVRFSVFKDAYNITGRLQHISADSLIDEVTGLDYFEANIELLEEDLELLGDYQLVPGMPAQVVVKTGSRTLVGYLTSPLKRMFDNALLED